MNNKLNEKGSIIAGVFFMLLVIPVLVISYLKNGAVSLQSVVKSVSAGEVKIEGTDGVYVGGGMSGGNGFPFTFTISPSGKYILLLKADRRLSNSLPASLVLVNTTENKIQEISASSVSSIAVGFSKKCWNIDETRCYDDEVSMHQNYTRSHTIMSPFSFVDSSERTGFTNEHKIEYVDAAYCSDCQPRSFTEKATKKFSDLKGDGFLEITNHTVGKSGKIYFKEGQEGGTISVFDPNESSFTQIYHASKNICPDQLQISPDETKLAFSEQSNCSGWAGKQSILVLNLASKKDTDYGKKNLSGVSEFSWSPDSKFLYYVKTVNDISAIYRLTID